MHLKRINPNPDDFINVHFNVKKIAYLAEIQPQNLVMLMLLYQYYK
jgi:hypothetical protein